MKLENIEKKLSAIKAGDKAKLGSVARDVGNELPRNRVELLRQLRCLLAGANLGRIVYDDKPATQEFVDGACCALLEIVAAYEAAIEGECWTKARQYKLPCVQCQHLAQMGCLTVFELLTLEVIDMSDDGELHFRSHIPQCAQRAGKDTTKETPSVQA